MNVMWLDLDKTEEHVTPNLNFFWKSLERCKFDHMLIWKRWILECLMRKKKTKKLLCYNMRNVTKELKNGVSSEYISACSHDSASLLLLRAIYQMFERSKSICMCSFATLEGVFNWNEQLVWKLCSLSVRPQKLFIHVFLFTYSNLKMSCCNV